MNLFTSLRYVVALHEHRHFGRAAEACHISQPAFSNAIRALEEEFETVIVKRGRAFEGFTAEGELIYQSAQRILREQQVLQQELKSSVEQPMGQLRIGAVPSAMPVAARFAARLQGQYPGIRPVLRFLNSQDIEQGLESLSLDIGWGYTNRPQRRGDAIHSVAQYTEQYYLLRRAPASGARTLQFGAAIPWAQVADMRLCLLTTDMYNRHLIDAALAQAGVQVTPVLETDSILALALATLDGEISSILPGALVGALHGYGELEALPLSQPEMVAPVGLLVLQTDRMSRVVQSALDMAASAQWQQLLQSVSGSLHD